MRPVRRIGFAFFLLCAALGSAQAEERITRFISDVQVQRNGDLLVTESISLRAEGQQIRRGILRDFPTTYSRPDGSRVEVGFTVTSVTRDDSPEDFATERLANGVRVRIGSASRTITTGMHDYVIAYRTTRQIGFFKDFDELYWNATGNGWTFPIDMAEARITLPDAVPFAKTAFFTGAQGETGKDATIVSEKPGQIVFRTTKPLPVRHGLTVAADWPKGVVAPPTLALRLSHMLEDDPALGYAAFGFLVMAFYLVAWLLVGRDPPRGTIVPLFAPPEGMSAAAVRYVENEGFDDRVFACAIVGLGVNHCLKIAGTGSETTITRLEGGRPADAAEQATVTALFSAKPAVLLDHSDHAQVSGARVALWKTLRGTYAGKMFNANYAWSTAGFVASAVVVALVVYALLATYPSSDKGGWLVAATLVPLLPIMIAAGMIYNGSRLGRTGQLIGGIIIGAIFVVGGLAVVSIQVGSGIGVLPIAVVYALASIAALGFAFLKAPTREGRQQMDRIEGFRQYLSIAEEDRLEALNPPTKTPELFERFLPYALALDVQNSWAKRFAGVLAAGATGAAVGTWYAGGQSITSDPVAFADNLSAGLTQTISAAAQPPGSSASEGGISSSSSSGSSSGSSGGGGGGGGGSGW